jgi:5-enolpyruvylshikimate-3-phosphate synthase
MNLQEKTTLKIFSFLCFTSTLKGKFKLNNVTPSNEALHFINILQSLGFEVYFYSNSIEVNSLGALHFFEPQAEIDVKGSYLTTFALCGLLAPYDYTVFLIDSTKKLDKFSFSPLILGLWEVGVRFTYSRNFCLPLSIKGTSNFLPMTHSILSSNHALELAFLSMGLQGIGKTHLISKNDYGFGDILTILNANCKIKKLEDEALDIEVSLLPQNINKKIEITL